MSSIYTVLLFILPISIFAQNSDFRNPQNGTRYSFGVEKIRSASIASGDIDADGDIDIIIANGRHWTASNKIFLNNGKGQFTVSYDLGFYESTSYAAEVGDLDGDGDLDIAVGNDKAPNRLFINNGKGKFVEGKTFGTLH
jgi:hypothetical protein